MLQIGQPATAMEVEYQLTRFVAAIVPREVIIIHAKAEAESLEGDFIIGIY